MIVLLLFQVYSLECTSKRNFMIQSSTYPFKLEDLPYPSSFLSEVISETMLILHHDTHQNSYLLKLNSFIQSSPFYLNKTLSDLNQWWYNSDSLQKYAGGLYNHYFYWWILTAPGCSSPVPTGNLLKKISSTWGNFTNFKSAFDSASLNLFGNGWVWLCVNQSYQLEIRSSFFQINPMMTQSSPCYPVLGNDLWEHAYYLRFTSDKGTYVKYFWDLVDWGIAEFFYEVFASQLAAVPF